MFAFAFVVVPLVHAADGWEASLERVTAATVSLKINVHRSLADGVARIAGGTGFVVDKERGILLTNAHVMTSGPTTATATMASQEVIDLTPLYRDPAHDFAFFGFEPSHVEHMELTELSLAPEKARAGVEIRIVGNDASERISILDGTISRVDRNGPTGKDGNNNNNTFLIQTAASATGGSSGSPVVDIDGDVLALHCASWDHAATTFGVPMQRIAHVLARLQSGQTIRRGTWLAVWEHHPFDTLRHVRFPAEREAQIRASDPESSGLLVLSRILPDSPLRPTFRSGDVLASIDGIPVRDFVDLAHVLDNAVGTELELVVLRLGEEVRAAVPVLDLRAMTVGSFLEVGGGVFHDLTYQQTVVHDLPARGVYVSQSAYAWLASGIPNEAIVMEIDGNPIANTSEMAALLRNRRQGERIRVGYVLASDREAKRPKEATVRWDHMWHPWTVCERLDEGVAWTCKGAEEASRVALGAPRGFPLPVQSEDARERNALRAMARVEFRARFETSGNDNLRRQGVGVVVDAARGWVLADRFTVPVSAGEVELVFLGGYRLSAEILALHPVHNFALLKVDPVHLENVGVPSISLAESNPEPGRRAKALGFTSAGGVVRQETEIERFAHYKMVPDPQRSQHRELGVHRVKVDVPRELLGGVVLNRRGELEAFTAQFFNPSNKKVYRASVPVSYIHDLMTSVEAGGFHTLGVETKVTPTETLIQRGLSKKRAMAVSPTQSGLLEIVRVFGGAQAEGVLRPGDVLLEVNGMAIQSLLDLERAQAAREAKVTVLRRGEERVLVVRTSLVRENGTDRLVSWAGLLVHEPHFDLSVHTGRATKGVFLASSERGSPARRYRVWTPVNVTAINGMPTPDLDAFLEVIQVIPNGDTAQLDVVTLSGARSIATLQVDDSFWPTRVFERRGLTWVSTVLSSSD